MTFATDSAEIAARMNAVKFAIANTSIEGAAVSPEAEALFERSVNGEIDDGSRLNKTLRPTGPEASYGRSRWSARREFRSRRR